MQNRSLFGAPRRLGLLIVSLVIGLVGASCAPTPGFDGPVVVGEPKVGAELTATIGDWLLAPKEVIYAWWSCETLGREECRQVGRNEPRYQVEPEDLDRWISVSAVGQNDSGWNTHTSRPVGPVTGDGGSSGDVEWGTPAVNIAQAPGTTLATAVGVTGELASFEGLAIRADGPLAGVAVVDPRSLRPGTDGVGFVFDVVSALPSDASAAVTGSLVIENGDTRLAEPLPVTITPVVPDSTTIPPVISEPSPDRIITLPDGSKVVRDEIVIAVDFEVADGDAVARAAAAATGGRIIGADPALRIYQLQFPGVAYGDLAAKASAARAVEGVVESALNFIADDPTTVIPNDPEWGDWGTPGGDSWGLEAIGAPAAWDESTGSADVRVGVIDFDFDARHGDLQDNVSRGDTGDPSGGHGTHVSGTACAEGNNGTGITGVAWTCDLRMFAGSSSVAVTASRMRAAVDDGAEVVNMSLNYVKNGDCAADDSPEGVGNLSTIADNSNDLFGRAVIYAQSTDRDVLWTLAAGNDCGRDIELTAPGGLSVRFPQTTMGVAAIGQDGNLASFSNLGSGVSVAAPGVDILSSLPRECLFWVFFCSDQYGKKSGTSMATPHVAGLAALVRSEFPDKTAPEVKGCIVAAAQRFGGAVGGQPFRTINAPEAVSCEAAPDLPSKVDIVVALDLTGSMGGVLSQAKLEASQLINNISAAVPGTDFKFAVVSYEDYAGRFDSTICPDSTYTGNYGSSGDAPFVLRSALSSDKSSTQSAINTLRLGGGSDGPESYGRALWELAQADTGAELGWRPDALRLVLNFGDNVPHDTNLNEGVKAGVYDTGVDPGRNNVVDCGGDDIDFQDDALGSLKTTGTRLLHVDSSGGSFSEEYWRYWASLTGGAYTRLGDGRTLSDVLIELLGLIDA